MYSEPEHPLPLFGGGESKPWNETRDGYENAPLFGGGESKPWNETRGGYENAPACKMLATHCCVCARPLLDAKSVELGIGPECRRKHGFDVEIPEESRKLANAIVAKLACNRDDSYLACDSIKELTSLGLGKLASILADRLATVKIEINPEGRYFVRTPYDPAIVQAMRNIVGRKWDATAKVNTFPVAARPALFALLRTFYHGKLVIGPRGPFVVEG
jgi:hypothetical protein